MMNIRFVFGSNETHFTLDVATSSRGQNRVERHIWSKQTYSRQSALKRADRFVGERLRETLEEVSVIYVKGLPDRRDPTVNV